MLDPTKPPTTASPAADDKAGEVDPRKPIEVASTGTSATNDSSGTDRKTTTQTSPVGP